ncbi:MAG TPA: FAD-binding protein [Polyangiaceae bacterium]|nr:FAD-binding protein [Polyangiaceae bacterium]
MTVLVVGGGLAGVAAAWSLERRGRPVLLVWDGPGASATYSGALDRLDWDGPPDPRPVAREAQEFLQALGCWAPCEGVGARLATASGVLRPARAHDLALLDLEPLRGRRIEVVDAAIQGWDAPDLARAWSASGWARLTRTEFCAVPARLPEAEALRFLPESELAARADDPAWAAALGEALRGAGDGEAPLLCGPWLGLQPRSVLRVREAARRPLGEVLSGPGGPAGFRFEAARDAWLERSSSGVQARCGAVLDVQQSKRGLAVWMSAGDGKHEALEPAPSELVLAVGGVAGGGVRFLAGTGAESRSFSLSLRVAGERGPLTLRLDGREVSLESGAQGVDLQSLGRGALERVGVLVDGTQLTAVANVWAAGDVVADRPRAGLEAIYAGIAAARGVCRVSASQIPLTV